MTKEMKYIVAYTAELVRDKEKYEKRFETMQYVMQKCMAANEVMPESAQKIFADSAGKLMELEEFAAEMQKLIGQLLK